MLTTQFEIISNFLSLVSLFQNESKCKTFLMKMADFNLHENEPAGGTHFHKNGFALNLAFKQRHKGYSEMAYCITSFPGSLSFMPCINPGNEIVNY